MENCSSLESFSLLTSNISNLSHFFKCNLSISKTSERSQSFIFWGRKAIQALDRDHPEAIVNIFFREKDIYCSNIHEKVALTGYSGYLWTRNIHNNLGDNIIHLAIKFRKLKCLYAILLYNSSKELLESPNANNEKSDELCMKYYQKSIYVMKSIAYDEIIKSMNPLRFEHILPDTADFRSLRKEAFMLMENGQFFGELKKSNDILSMRVVSADHHKSVRFSDITSIRPKNVHAVWRRRHNGNEVYLLNTVTGESKILQPQEERLGYWDVVRLDSGDTYAVNELTGRYHLLQERNREGSPGAHDASQDL